MSLQFILGPSGSGKSTYIFDQVITEMVRNPKQRYLVLVPDQFTMQTQSDLVKLSPNGGIMNAEVLSFSRLAHRVFEETGGGRVPVLDDTGKNLILRKCAVDVKDKIPYLAGKLDKAGYIHEVKSAISEFMQYGIDSKGMDELIATAKDANRRTLHGKLESLAVIYDYFKEYIKDRYITTEEAMDILAREVMKSEIVHDSIVILDGFTGFTPVQNKVIESLLMRAKHVFITLSLDGDALTNEVKEQDLFAFTTKSYLSLLKLAGNIDIPVMEPVILRDTVRFSKSPELKFLERNLYRYPVKAYGGDCKNITIDGCLNIAEEVDLLVSNIRSLIKKGCKYRDIAVVTGNLSAYVSEIADRFNDYAIPVYIDETKGIVLNPFVEYIKCALQVILSDFNYESMMQYLRSGFVGLSLDEIDRLDNYIVSHGIRGKSAYMRLFTKADDDLDMLNDIRERIMYELEPLIDGGITKTSKLNAYTYVKSTFNFIDKNGAADKLDALALKFEGEADFARAKEYEQIYTYTCKLLEQVYDLVGDEIMSLEEYYGILEAGFSELQVGLLPQSVDRVIVGDMERTRLKPVKYLFFLGLNDGWVPKSGNKGGIISDSDREFLVNSGAELAPSPRQQMYIGRFYLYSNLTKPSDKLFLSYIAMNGEGQSMRASYVAGLIKEMFPNIKQTAADVSLPGTERELIRLMSDYMRKYADATITDVEQQMLYNIISIVPKEEYMDILIKNAFYRYEKLSLDERIAGILYGARMYASISRMETYARCAYAYFLQYGLGLKEKQEYGIEAKDMGNIYHGVLEIFIDLLKEKNLSWNDVCDRDVEDLVNEAVEREAVLFTDAILFESNSNRYVLERMKSVMLRTVKTLAYQLKNSTFMPERYEYSFVREQSLGKINLGLNEEEKIYLKGKIDRLDVSRQDDKVLVKIVDYKSGNKDFSLMSFYHGLQLQMVVYMNEAVRAAKIKEPDKEVVPAALLYYHIDDPLVEADSTDSDETIEDKIVKELRTKGIVNDDSLVIDNLDTALNGASDVIPVKRNKNGSLSANSHAYSESDLRLMMEYADKKILSIASQMMDGDISLNPIEIMKTDRGVELSSCEYCNYKNVCGFDPHMPGNKVTVYEKQSDEDLLNAMRNELEAGGIANA